MGYIEVQRTKNIPIFRLYNQKELSAQKNY